MKTKEQRFRTIASLFLAIVLSIAVSAVFTACSKKGEESSQQGETVVEYTVTYNVDGATSTVTVKNGQAVSKPGDPQKDGYEFYGWYIDAAFSKAYSFGTAVTADITLYARLVPISQSADEFDVFFKDGDTVVKTTRTNEGVIAGELPVLSGNFVGWWVSDYDDATKLTYQYDGRTLGRNTTLYAVYDTGAPTISVTGEGNIKWSGAGANKNYSVNITDTRGYTLKVDTTALFYPYGFEDREAGDYVITVTVDGKTGYAFFRNKGLDKISRFNVDSYMLTFNDVGADYYLLEVDCGDKEHNHSALNLGTSTYYNFINCEMQEGGIKFIVTAVADGKAESVSEFVYERNLPVVEGLAVNTNDLLEWTALADAENYTVTISSGDDSVSKYVGSATNYSIANYSGQLTITVTASAKGYNSSSTTIVYPKTKLATPSGIKVTMDSVSWDAVEGATGYTLKIGKNYYDTATTTFALTSELNLPSTGYEVSVKANASSSANDSIYSDSISVVRNHKIENIYYGDGKISWDPVYNAKSYIVKINDGAEVSVTDGSNELSVNFDKSGINTISVSYINAYDRQTEWVSKDVTVYALNFKTDADTTLLTRYYAAGDEIVYPDATKTGYTLGNWYNDLGAAQQNAAKFSDKIFAGGTDTTLYASWLANTYKVTLVSGEFGVEITEPVSVTYNTHFELPIPVATSNLKGFIGWYTGTEGSGAKYTDGLGVSMTSWSVTEDVTVYARWEDVFNFEYDENVGGYVVSKSGYTSAVKEITIPATYKKGEDGEELPVVMIDASAFMLCRNLVTINIPDSIQDIQTGTAFKWCYDLANVNIYESDYNVKGDYYSYDGALFRKNINGELEISYFPIGRTGEYHIPANITGKDENGDPVVMSVKEITSNVFNQAILEKVYIPYTIQLINANAFNNCDSLEEIVFDETPAGVTEVALTINDYAFYYCDVLRAITLTTRINNFKSTIINYCEALEYVDIIGTGSAYSSVEGMITNSAKDTLIYVPLGRIGTVRIPEGITKIAANAFRTGNTQGSPGCQKVTKVIIPGWVTEIGDSAFYNCSNLTEVVFEGTVEDAPLTICERAFYRTGLTSLTLSENVKTVKEYAFGNTRNLNVVFINSAGDIHNTFAKYAFSTFDEGNGYVCNVRRVVYGPLTGRIDIAKTFDLQKLSIIEIDENNPNHYIDVEDGGVIYYAGKTDIEFYPITKSGAYVVPATVTSIPADFFAGNSNLTSIVIGAGVTSIGERAFQNCYNLTSVTFADGCAITSIGDMAFQNCRKLASFTLPDTVTSLGAEDSMLVFDGCSLINTITINNNVGYAFDEYGVLYSSDFTKLLMCFPDVTGDENGAIVVKPTTTTIGAKAFSYNKKVKTIDFRGTGITSFGAGLFENNTAIKNLYLPEAITAIGEGMFKGCSGLETFTISKTITTIGTSAFENCSNLETIIIEEGRTAPLVFADGAPASGGRPPVPAKTTFSGATKLKSITLPAGVVVGACVFMNSSIETVVFLGDATIGPRAFQSSKVKTVTFNGAVTFGDGAGETGAIYCFSAANQLETIDFGANNGITTIPNSFFNQTTKLTTITGINYNNLTSIGSNAFYGCGIDSFTFGDSLDTVGNYAFYNCTKLTNVTFTENCSITEMPDYLFSGCSKLESIVLPAGTTKIGQAMFNGCTSLSSFTIPEGVTAIPYRAFYNTGLTSIVIPAAVTSIGQDAFRTSSKLASITFENTEEKPSQLSAINTNYAFGGTAIEEFVFPETEYSISLSTNGIFRGLFTLKRVVLSSGVVTSIASITSNNDSINNEGFEIVFPDNGKIIKENGVIYDKDKTILYGIFANEVEGDTLVIPETVKTIRSYAFSGLTTLKEITITENVESIGAYAFYNCSGLETVNFNTTKVTGINSYTFYGCSSLSSITLPASVTFVDMYAFYNCAELKSINLDHVELLGTSAFYGSGLEEVNLSSITGYIQSGSTASTMAFSNAFYNCKNLTKVDFGTSTLTYLMSGMFNGCSALEEVILNANQTNIENSVFAGCTSLKSIDLSSITSTISHRNNAFDGNSIFRGCTSLETVVLNNALTRIGSQAFDGCTSLVSINIPSNVTVIDNYAFRNCTSLASIKIPDGVTSIGMQAFLNCESLTAVRLPNALTSIGNYAFQNANLSTIVIPAKVSTMGTTPFAGNKNLESVIFDDGNNEFKSMPDGGVYDKTDRLLFFAPGAEGVVTIGSSVIFGANILAGCDKVTGVILSEGIGDIPDQAFANATGIETIVIPSTVRSIGAYAFQNATSLKSVIIPDSVTSIGMNAFEGCTSLEYVKLPVNLAELSTRVFLNCTSLEEVVLPENLEAICGKAFENCTSLTTIVLPASLKKIGCTPTGGKPDPDFQGSTFKNCTSLTQIIIPEGVNELYEDTFSGWTDEQTIVFQRTQAEVASFATAGWDNECNATITYAE